MSIYDLLDVGRWKPLFKKEFPNGHFLPLPKGVILTQEICDRFPKTLLGAIQKQNNKVHLYATEPLTLDVSDELKPLPFQLPLPPSLSTPIWTHEEALHYVLSSWFNALEHIDKKKKFIDLVFLLARDKKKGIKVTYLEDLGMYKARIIYAEGSNLIPTPTYIYWNESNLRLKVGRRFQQSTGTSYLMKDNPLSIPTKYILLTMLNQIVGSERGIEDLDYRDINSLFNETYLWLDPNSMGEREIYGMKHPSDSTSFQKEFSKGMYLAVDMSGDKDKYPLFFTRKFTTEDMPSGKEALMRFHERGIPVITEKNGRVFQKSLIIGYKGVNNSWVGYKKTPDGKGIYIIYLPSDKPEKMLNRIITGTGGNRAEMSGMTKSNIHIVNIDGSITSQYGYPINYFICLGRGYGGNSGVVPVHKDFYIPYKVRKQFLSTVYVDNIPLNSEVGEYIRNKAKAYESSNTPSNNALVKALAEYIKECIQEQVLPLLEENPDRTWKNTFLLTLFNKGKGKKPFKAFHITGNNREYSFPLGIDVDDMVQEGLNCVHISAEMYFKGKPGQPFKLRMLGGKTTTLPCDFTVYQSDNSTPYEKHIDVLMSNETVKGSALWWIAYAQLNGPSYLYPNEGLMKVGNGEVVNFLEPNNLINQWLEENAEEVWVEYKVNREVLRVLRQEHQFIQEWGEVNPNADIHVVEIYDDWALIRERVIGIHACIPLGYVELSTAEEKVNKSTLTSQQFASLAILNERLFKGLVEASSWKRDVVEKLIRFYTGNPLKIADKTISSNKSEQFFLPILLKVKKDLDTQYPESKTNLVDAHLYIEKTLSSDSELMDLIESVYPNGFIYTHKDISVPICLSVLEIYAKRDNISQDVLPITAQVLSVIRKLAWAFLHDSQEGIQLGKAPGWISLKKVVEDLDLRLLSLSINGWMRALLGDDNSDSKVLAALGRITSCAQATVKTSHLPSCANYVKKDDKGDYLYSIPIFYLHPDDDLLYILFGKDIPDTNDESNPYFIAVTRTPLGFWTFGRLIISEEHGWLSHITMNCVVAQLSSETDGDGDMLTIIPITMYDDSLTYEDIHIYNQSHIGYMGYGLQGKDSTLIGFYEPKSKWGSGKHPFRTKQHPLIPIKRYESPDFVSLVDEDTWANTAEYIASHYLLNVGTGYSAYSYVCFATCKEVEDFKYMCHKHIQGVTNTQIISFLNKVGVLESLDGIDTKIHGMLVSRCKTTIAHLTALSLTSRVMYEGMGLSGYKPKAYSIFSLFLALTNNPQGTVIAYYEPGMNSEYPLYIRANDTRRLDEIPEQFLLKHTKGTHIGEVKVFNGVQQLIPALFPKEVINICNGVSTDDDYIYDPITNSYETYKDGMYVNMHSEVIGIVRKAGYWGFIHSRLKRGEDPQVFNPNDVLCTVTYRVLRDFTSGSLGNQMSDVLEFGEQSSMSLYLWTLFNDKNPKWKEEIVDLIPSTHLRDMLLRALPLFEQVYLYKQINQSASILM